MTALPRDLPATFADCEYCSTLLSLTPTGTAPQPSVCEDDRCHCAPCSGRCPAGNHRDSCDPYQWLGSAR